MAGHWLLVSVGSLMGVNHLTLQLGHKASDMQVLYFKACIEF